MQGAAKDACECALARQRVTAVRSSSRSSARSPCTSARSSTHSTSSSACTHARGGAPSLNTRVASHSPSSSPGSACARAVLRQCAAGELAERRQKSRVGTVRAGRTPSLSSVSSEQTSVFSSTCAPRGLRGRMLRAAHARMPRRGCRRSRAPRCSFPRADAAALSLAGSGAPRTYPCRTFRRTHSAP